MNDVLATIDYARPTRPKSVRRIAGYMVGLGSLLLSIQIAAAVISDAYTLAYPSPLLCGTAYGRVQTHFFERLPRVEMLAVVGWVICSRAGAGSALCRVGVLAAAATWIGAFWFLRL